MDLWKHLCSFLLSTVCEKGDSEGFWTRHYHDLTDLKKTILSLRCQDSGILCGFICLFVLGKHKTFAVTCCQVGNFTLFPLEMKLCLWKYTSLCVWQRSPKGQQTNLCYPMGGSCTQKIIRGDIHLDGIPNNLSVS